MKRTVSVLIGVCGVYFATAALAGEMRYVVRHGRDDRKSASVQYPLWESWAALQICVEKDVATVLGGGKLDAGPKRCPEAEVGSLSLGTKVELLDSHECRDMVYVRVLTGPLKGKVGCFPPEALSSLQP